MAVAVLRSIKSEIFYLTQADATAQTDSQVENYALRYTYAPIWKYQVPVNQEFVLAPEHKLSVYIEDDESSPAEWRSTQKVRVEWWDASLKKMEIIWEGRYISCKEEQDQDKMARLDIIGGEPLEVKSGDWIIIAGMSDDTLYTIDVSDSRFTLECRRFRPTLIQ